MSEQAGVPIDEATAKDHIQVRAKLVKRLGGANAALVWSRIYYRADEVHRAAEEVAGEWWWQASYALLAEETGLTEKQARAAIDSLVDDGYVNRRPGKGRAFLYRAVTFTAAHLPSGADTAVGASDLEGRSIGPVGQIHLPSGAITPLIDKEDVIDTPVVPAADPVVEGFERVWEAWPSARRGARKKAESSWRTAVKAYGPSLDLLLADVGRFIRAWRSWAPSEIQFVPLLQTWLNQERWTMPTPEMNKGRKAGTVEAGQAAADILRERRASREQKAVAS